MNKKGFFYSLTVLLFLFFFMTLFSSTTQILESHETTHINRAKYVVTDRFIRDFEDYYVPHMLGTAAKPALTNSTNMIVAVTKAELAELMKDGAISGVTINPLLTIDYLYPQALASLSYKLNPESFKYRITNVDQISRELEITFEYDFSFETEDSRWWKDNGVYVLKVPIDGLYHPSYPGNKPINSSWNIVTGTTCYADIIFSGASVLCTDDFVPI